MADAQVLNDIEGVVKWLDARKGFGFIVGTEGNAFSYLFPISPCLLQLQWRNTRE